MKRRSFLQALFGIFLSATLARELTAKETPVVQNPDQDELSYCIEDPFPVRGHIRDGQFVEVNPFQISEVSGACNINPAWSVAPMEVELWQSAKGKMTTILKSREVEE